MDEKFVNRARKLKREIREAIANRLTYPKSVIGIAKDRCLTTEEIEKIKTCVDESILLIDAKFCEFFDELVRGKSNAR